MFDIGFGEMILLGVIALIFIGPKQLPEVARVVGRMLNEFKRTTQEFTSAVVNARDQTNDFISQTQHQITQSFDPAHSDPNASSGEPAASEEQMAFDLHKDQAGAAMAAGGSAPDGVATVETASPPDSEGSAAGTEDPHGKIQ